MKSAAYTGPEPCSWTAVEALGRLASGDITPLELIDAAFERIAQAEPAVNAMPTLCRDRAESRAASVSGLQAGVPGWLGGMPIGIKDLNPVAGVRTTWGTRGFADFVPEESDPLVELIESRGGIVVGKTNTPEMGAGGNTFNEVFGCTRNPWNVARNAGGSSGGAAVSLATGEVWLSHGSDLAGSLRTPAAYCGVVGLRPAPGRAGGAPKTTAFEMEAVQGPMARNVEDCALFLDAMCGYDPRQPLSLEAPLTPFLSEVRKDPGSIRIAYAPDHGGFAEVEPEIKSVMSAALGAAEGPAVEVDEDCPDLSGLEETYRTLRGMLYASVNARVPDEVKRHFKETLMGNIRDGLRLRAEQIFSAIVHRTTLYNRMLGFFSEYDALASAVVGLEPGPVEEEYPKSVNGARMGDYVEWLKLSFLATTVTLPAISIPCGFTRSGMPVGMQLIGPPRGEARLLQVARYLEEAWGLHSLLPIDPA